MKSLFLKLIPMWFMLSIISVACTAPPLTAIPGTPTPILAPTETITTPQSDDVWDRIAANQKIVVGTSWDYPPFSSVNSNFEVVGFDIALIEEIGRRLQIPIEIQNYTFEGLPAALQTNQIDLAIAAIVITPERVNEVSFSPIYYVNQTAILARNDGLISSITNFNQLSDFRVGVRRGTVYEDMVQNYLVNSGQMNPDNLFRYMQTDESVRDLVENRVDAVVFGHATANYYADQQNLKMVGVGFLEHNLAIAMRLGTPRLNAEIERVMNEMLTDGTILGLIQEYLHDDINDVENLSTAITPNQPIVGTQINPAPTAAPLGCVDGMKFLADVTFGDNNMKSPPYVAPGKEFIKTWRVQNTGSCTWTTDYRFVYSYGNVSAAQMSGQAFNIPVEVAPGETIELSVTLIAPIEPLIYQGFWNFQNNRGQSFGQTVWVAISTK